MICTRYYKTSKFTLRSLSWLSLFLGLGLRLGLGLGLVGLDLVFSCLRLTKGEAFRFVLMFSCVRPLVCSLVTLTLTLTLTLVLSGLCPLAVFQFHPCLLTVFQSSLFYLDFVLLPFFNLAHVSSGFLQFFNFRPQCSMTSM
jgi:hypothetical protein